MAYQSTHVRHLAWCLFSEPMAKIYDIANLSIKPSSDLLQWLKAQDENPSSINAYINTHNARLLGSYFECLWQYYFTHAPKCRLFQHHVQVFKQKQTIGELDILAEHENVPLHLELAVKFYLLMPHKSGIKLHHWLGPQSHDRLDKKLSILAGKQFPLLYNSVTTQKLQELDINLPYTQALALKGYLFTPLKQTEYVFHPSINPNVNTGKWLHVKQINELLEHPSRWSILEKKNWLGPYQKTESDSRDSYDNAQVKKNIEEHFNEQAYAYALLLIKLDQQNKEVERYMVVHEHWPEPLTLKKTN
ncbi:DUF1853 family protein [Oceaniserpentilla sp. 4NH20-0058]|uniref:DUF1853 family protein n=1 Tax=Oceaniserpentilla sp. 4NH20-0058 TaxID=3127660 RepID=UPI00333EB861